MKWRAIGMAIPLLGLTAVPMWADGDSGAGASNSSAPAVTAQQFEGAPFWLDPVAAKGAADRANAWNNMSACQQRRVNRQLPPEMLDLGVLGPGDASRVPLSILGTLGQYVFGTPAYATEDCGCCWIRRDPCYTDCAFTIYVDCSTGDAYDDPQKIPPDHYHCAILIDPYNIRYSTGWSQPCPSDPQVVCRVSCNCCDSSYTSGPCNLSYPELVGSVEIISTDCACPDVGWDWISGLLSQGTFKFVCTLCVFC